MNNIILNALLIWLVIGVAEILHGIRRFRLLDWRFAEHGPCQIGVFTSLIITGAKGLARERSS